MRRENHGSHKDRQVANFHASMFSVYISIFFKKIKGKNTMEKPTAIDEEYVFQKGLIISSTDLKGMITYVNRKFCEIARYNKDELMGKNHNIIRHPDMPKAAFRNLWDTIQAGKEWTGIVKNLRKDGKYYWVYSHITPILKDETMVGYSAAIRPTSENEITESTALYAEMIAKENE